MARPTETYRGARRNQCLRTKPKSSWSPQWYYLGQSLLLNPKKSLPTPEQAMEAGRQMGKTDIVTEQIKRI